MKELFELYLYPDLQVWIEEISYFFANDVQNSPTDNIEYVFLDDALLLMEYVYNCKHIHKDLIDALRIACERELLDRGITGTPIEIINNKIYFNRNKHYGNFNL